MSEKTLRRTRQAVRHVVADVARDAMVDIGADLLAIRGILYRGFWGRLRWLLTGR